jgi:hypothetical protein
VQHEMFQRYPGGDDERDSDSVFEDDFHSVRTASGSEIKRQRSQRGSSPTVREGSKN